MAEPGIGINLYDRMGNTIFAAGTPQLKFPLPSIKKNESLAITFELCCAVSPGEYTFSMMVSEPSSQGPNAGNFHDVIHMLGPIIVSADESAVYPFYGIAKLPLKISCGSISKKNDG